MARSHGKGGVDNYVTTKLLEMVGGRQRMTLEQAMAKLYMDIPDEQLKRLLASAGSEEPTSYGHLREIFSEGTPPPSIEMVRRAFFLDICVYYVEGNPLLREMLLATTT
jgi:hypothetical protein